MPNTVISPNMTITVPVTGVDPGPDWASRIQTALFTTIDAHNHAAGNGVQITPAGLNINADLPFGSFNATALRTSRYTSQAVALNLGSDVGCLYNVLGDAYWNNAAGTAIQLTKNGVVNASTLVWPLHPGTSGGTIQATDPYLIYYADTSSAPQTFNLPSAAALTPGRTYLFVDTKSNAATNNISLVPNGTDKINGSNSTYVINTNGAEALLTSDGVSAWYVTVLAPIASATLTFEGQALRISAAGSGNGLLQWPSGQATPTIGQASTSGATGATMVWAPQASTGNPGTAGNALVQLANKVGTGNIPYFQVQQGTSLICNIGGWNNANNPTAGVIWLGTVTPSITNFCLYGDGTTTALNSPNTFQFLIANTGNTPTTFTTNGWQFGSLTPAFGGGVTVLGISTVTTVPTAASTNGLTLWANAGSPGSLGLFATGVAFHRLAGAIKVAQDTATTDVATTAFTVAAQSAWASASTNVNGATLNLQGGNSTNATAGALLALGGATNAGSVLGAAQLSASAVGGASNIPWAWSAGTQAITTGTFTLSAAQIATPFIVLTGTLSGACTLVFPNAPGFWLLDVASLVMGANSLTLKSGTGTSFAYTSTQIGSTVTHPTLLVVVTQGGNVAPRVSA